MKTILFLFVFLLSALINYAQTNSLHLRAYNQPNSYIVLGSLKGDRFVLIDSIQAVDENLIEAATSQFKSYIHKFSNNTPPGMYRLIFGKTLYAKVMNEPPQQLDFIFNKKNIEFETDFKAPEDSLIIRQSDENIAWFNFKEKERMYGKWQKQLREVVNNLSSSSVDIQFKKDKYNRAIMEREDFVTQSVKTNQHLFVSKLMQLYHEPLLDAYYSETERLETYKKEYFNILDFSDEELVNTTIYTDKVIQYIQSYGQYGITREQQEDEFIKAVDIVLNHVNKNQAVYELILDYIMRGFEKLNLNKTLFYIGENYSGTTCQTDEKTTLERRLNSQRMKIGSVVPDFILNDLNGDAVQLSQILKERTLILFWASWCSHCISTIPGIKGWQQTHNSENVEIITIALDTSVTDWHKQVGQLSIESWFNLSDLKGWDGKVTGDYNVYATPTMFLINQDQKIIAKPITLQGLLEY